MTEKMMKTKISTKLIHLELGIKSEAQLDSLITEDYLVYDNEKFKYIEMKFSFSLDHEHSNQCRNHDGNN